MNMYGVMFIGMEKEYKTKIFIYVRHYNTIFTVANIHIYYIRAKQKPQNVSGKGK